MDASKPNNICTCLATRPTVHPFHDSTDTNDQNQNLDDPSEVCLSGLFGHLPLQRLLGPLTSWWLAFFGRATWWFAIFCTTSAITAWGWFLLSVNATTQICDNNKTHSKKDHSEYDSFFLHITAFLQSSMKGGRIIVEMDGTSHICIVVCEMRLKMSSFLFHPLFVWVRFLEAKRSGGIIITVWSLCMQSESNYNADDKMATRKKTQISFIS